MKLSLSLSTVGLGALLALSSFNCSSSSSKGGDGAAGSSGHDGGAGADAAAGTGGTAGSDAAAGSGGGAGSDAAAGNDGAAGSDAAAGNDGAAGSDAAAGSDGAAGSDASEAGDSATGDGGDAAATSALESAELALTDGTDFNLLTATHTELESGEQTPIGWGPRTLPTQQQRDAATALVRRIAALLPASARNGTNTGAYSAGDVNVLNALLTLNADPADLFSGANLAPAAGTAWEAYKAGAVADTAAPAGPAYLHGVAAGSTDAAFGAYISVNGSDPQGVVGLATNIVKVALKHGLETQLKAY